MLQIGLVWFGLVLFRFGSVWFGLTADWMGKILFWEGVIELSKHDATPSNICLCLLKLAASVD